MSISPFPITITVNSLPELNRVIAALGTSTGTSVGAAKAEPTKETTTTPAGSKAPAGKQYTLDEAKTMTVAAAKKGEAIKQQVIALLEKYESVPNEKKVRTAAGLPADKVQGYCEEVAELLK
jgi:hypothetical protein